MATGSYADIILPVSRRLAAQCRSLPASIHCPPPSVLRLSPQLPTPRSLVVVGSDPFGTACLARPSPSPPVRRLAWGMPTTAPANPLWIPFPNGQRPILWTMPGVASPANWAVREEMLCHEDYELNYRLRQAGGQPPAAVGSVGGSLRPFDPCR